MKQVAIVTDTTACVPREQVARYDIELVPVQLIIEDKTYRDGIDITPTEFTPVMGVHTGPGLIGVAFYGEDPSV